MKTKSLHEIGAFTGEELAGYSDTLQRTDEWLELRYGCWNGSENNDLMGCGRSTSKMGWDNTDKIIDFGSAAEKQVYKVGKERLTGEHSMQIDAKPLQHGRENEPLLIDQLLKDGIITDFKELSSEKFYHTGRASVDGVAKVGPNCKVAGLVLGEEITLELKCPVSWDGHYKRKYKKVDQTHSDWWQFQSEMAASGIKKLLYVVTLPMTFKKYDLELVLASDIHMRALISRCKIADRAIELWDKYSYQEALERACAEFSPKKEVIEVAETVEKVAKIEKKEKKVVDVDW
mgnify:CR=1 FL=1